MSYAQPQAAYPPAPCHPYPAYHQMADTGPIPLATVATSTGPIPLSTARAAPSTSGAPRPYSTPGVIVTGWIAVVVFALSHIWVAAAPGAAFVAAGLVKVMLLGMGLGLLSRALRATTEPTSRAGLAIAGAILMFAALGQALWVIPG